MCPSNGSLLIPRSRVATQLPLLNKGRALFLLFEVSMRKFPSGKIPLHTRTRAEILMMSLICQLVIEGRRAIAMVNVARVIMYEKIRAVRWQGRCIRLNRLCPPRRVTTKEPGCHQGGE